MAPYYCLPLDRSYFPPSVQAMASIYLVNALYNKEKSSRPADCPPQSTAKIEDPPRHDCKSVDAIHPFRQRIINVLGLLCLRLFALASLTSPTQVYLKRSQSRWPTRSRVPIRSPWATRCLLLRGAVSRVQRVDRMLHPVQSSRRLCERGLTLCEALEPPNCALFQMRLPPLPLFHT